MKCKYPPFILKVVPVAFFLFLGTVPLKGQEKYTGNFDIQWGEERLMRNSTNWAEIIGHDKDGYYILKKEHRYSIEKLDENLNFKGEEYIKQWINRRSREFEALIFFHDSLYLFTSDSFFKHKVLYVQTIDKESLKQNNDERIIADIPSMKGYEAVYYFQLSRQRKKLMVCCKTDAYLHHIQLNRFKVFDKGLSLDWNCRDTIMYNHRPPRETKYVVDEQGNVFVQNLIYEAQIWKLHTKLKNQYIFFSYTKKGKSINKYLFNIDYQFVRGIKIAPNEQGGFVCAGFYSNVIKYGIKGSFFFTTLPGINKISPLKKTEFDPDFLEHLMKQNQIDKGTELYTYYVKDLVLRKNGNFILSAQQEFDQSYDNYNDIILLSFTPKGEISWKKILFKTQSYQDGENYSSFYMVAPANRSRVEIIYNENADNPIENKALKKRKSFSANQKSQFIAAGIDEYGNLAKKTIYFRERKELVPQPLKAYDMLDGKVIMMARRYKKFKFLKLSFR